METDTLSIFCVMCSLFALWHWTYITHHSFTLYNLLKVGPQRVYAAPGSEMSAGPLTVYWSPEVGHEGGRSRGIYKPSTVNVVCCHPIWTGDTRLKWFEMRSGAPSS